MRSSRIIFYGKFIFTLMIIFVSFSSCVKIKPTVAIIYIRNSDGSACNGALVRLYGQPSEISTSNAAQMLRIDLTKQTDESGRAYFDLSDFYEAGQTGMAILNVDALKFNQVSTGFIQIKEQETNEGTFFLQ